MSDRLTSADYWRDAAADLRERLDRTTATLEGYEALTIRLQAERDAANDQVTNVIAMCDRHDNEREAARAADRRRIEGLESRLKQSQAEATQLGLLLTADREWMRQFAAHVESVLEKVKVHIKDTADTALWIKLLQLLATTRQTRERGETADAAGSSPAGETHEGSTPSAPTRRYCGARFEHLLRKGMGVATFSCERPREHEGDHGIPRWGWSATDDLDRLKVPYTLTSDQIEMANLQHGEGNWVVHEECPANSGKRSLHHRDFHQEWGNTPTGILRQVKAPE